MFEGDVDGHSWRWSRTCAGFGVVALSAVRAFPAVVYAAPPMPDRVSLSEYTVTWSTVNYATDAVNGLVDGSRDKTTIVDRKFSTQVIENRYLKVTLLPEFGGRILSIIYKPTGHEKQLYRTEVGVPYGNQRRHLLLRLDDGVWRDLPTFPDAEHGKTWLKPWDFRSGKGKCRRS